MIRLTLATPLMLAAASSAIAKPMTALELAEYKRCSTTVTMFNLWKCVPESKEPRAVDPEPQTDYDKLTREVAADEVRKYYIVAYAESPDPIARCVQAGMVVQAYLEAKASVSYNSWKRTEQRDCHGLQR